MKRLLITLLSLWSVMAMAAMPPSTILNEQSTVGTGSTVTVLPNNQGTSLGGIKTRVETGNTNILINPSFEHSTVTTGWTITNATASADTTNQVEGKKALSLSLTGALDVYQDSTVNAANLVGLQGNAGIKIKTSDVDGLKVCARNAGVTSTSLCINIPKDGAWKEINIPYILTATSNGIAITSTGTTGTVKLDDAFVGTSAPFQNVNGAKLVGTVTITGCASTWSTTSATFTDFGTQTGCAYATSGQALAPSTNIPAIKFASLPAGDYKIEYEGLLGSVGGVSSATAFRFWDGVNTSKETSSMITTSVNGYQSSINHQISYSSNQSNITLSIRGRSVSGSGNASINGTSTYPGTIKLWYFPPESKIYSQKEDWFIDANIGGANVTLSNSSSTYTEATNSSLDLVINSSKGSASAEIACASGTASSGLTCSAVNESVGIAFIPPRIGRYKACFSFSHNNYPSNTFLADTFQVIETSNTSSAILNEGGERITGKVNNSGNQNVAFPYKVCGRFNFTDTNKKTLRLMYESSNAGTINENWIYADRSSTFGQQDIHVSVEIEKAEIIGSFAGIEKCANDYECTDTFSAYVSSTGIVSNENIDWINGNAVWSPTGTATITLNTNLKDGTSGLSTGMNCVATSDNGTSSTPLSKVSSSTTTSIVVMQITGAGSSFNGGFYLKCQKGTNDYKPKSAKVATSTDVLTTPLSGRPVVYHALITGTPAGGAASCTLSNQYGLNWLSGVSAYTTGNGGCTLSFNGGKFTTLYNCHFESSVGNALASVGCIKIDKDKTVDNTTISFSGRECASGSIVAMDSYVTCFGVQ